jgi:hypothetical protein
MVVAGLSPRLELHAGRRSAALDHVVRIGQRLGFGTGQPASNSRIAARSS